MQYPISHTRLTEEPKLLPVVRTLSGKRAYEVECSKPKKDICRWISCSESRHWSLHIKKVQLHQGKRKSPLAPSLGIYLSPLHLDPGWTQATDRYWAARAQVVLVSNWVAGFIFETGLLKEADCSLGLIQWQSAWILLYMCTSLSGSN